MTTPNEGTDKHVADAEDAAASADEASAPSETSSAAESANEDVAEAPEAAESSDAKTAEDAVDAEAPGEENAAGEAGEAEEAKDGEDVEDEAAQLRAQLETLRAESAKLQDRMLRVAADFDNYKKRARRELGEATTHAGNRVALGFLEVLDNLERAIEHGERAEGADQTLLSGVQMVAKQFLGVLAKNEIEPFDSIGEPFDPELHEALQQMDSDEPRNTVIAQLQKGYKRGDRLVRAAMVIVSKGPQEPPAAPSEALAEAVEEGAQELREPARAERPAPIPMPPADDEEVEGETETDEAAAAGERGEQDSESEKKADE
ncbi:MAG: nucleotide exchange factor GrpE [Deltaproteobacteria bacterium]|nr:MAG: nucleotide exchange factor GrpE [Pseudomonadota bacterium]PIE65992.1 MAG: nucleotide exchange factor GrpE [Deltaproteobacteria bacterium]